MRRIAILGSTGSVGENVLRVVASCPDAFRIVGLAAGSNVRRLGEQLLELRPDVAAIGEGRCLEALQREACGSHTRLYGGVEGLVRVATHPEADVVVIATSGSAGLIPLLEAIAIGKTIALANKETLVMAGHLILEAARARGATLVPVDSEHSAIFQCLHGAASRQVRRVVLTGSGGPFREAPAALLSLVSPDEAVRHPKWQMGRKISVDSATLMNKGLEVIEAHWLFTIPVDQIEVVIHPEAIVHSMVEFIDGVILAQLGVHDMRLPIQYALTYPDRHPSALAGLDLTALGRLTFERPDHDRFPCLGLGYEAARAGGTAPCVLNAVNDVCVGAFLGGHIRLPDIPRVIQRVLAHHEVQPAPTLAQVLATDRWAREMAWEVLAEEAGVARPSVTGVEVATGWAG